MKYPSNKFVRRNKNKIPAQTKKGSVSALLPEFRATLPRVRKAAQLPRKRVTDRLADGAKEARKTTEENVRLASPSYHFARYDPVKLPRVLLGEISVVHKLERDEILKPALQDLATTGHRMMNLPWLC